jgi:hypothetical protein
MIEEIWKKIENYDNYFISNLGRVKTMDKNLIRKTYLDRDGYVQLTLSQNSKIKRFRMHQLVAKHFLSNPNNYKYVNHKDRNKQNNSVENLEWISFKDNCIHRNKTSHLARPMIKKSKKLKEKIIAPECSVWRKCVSDPNYEVSDTGYVRRNGRVLKNMLTPYGYHEIYFSNKGHITNNKVHRLVAEAFIPNPKNKEYINHIDGNKINNNVSNLEWSTPTENNIHARDTGLKTVCNKITAVNVETNEHLEFPSIKNMCDILNLEKASVYYCIKNKRSQTKGYEFIYDKPIKSFKRSKAKPIYAIDVQTKEKKLYPSMAAMVNELKMNKTNIFRVLQGTASQHHGYAFAYA